METPATTPSPGTQSGKLDVPSSPEAAVNVEMVFRVWTSATKEGEAVRAEQSAETHAGLLAFIEDVVTAKSAAFQATRDQLHVFGLKQPSDALVIARRVQAGLQGFRTKAGASTVAVSIAIDSSGQAATSADAAGEAEGGAARGDGMSNAPQGSAAGPSHDLLTLLKLSRPAQVLVTHDLCQRSADVKSLPLKSFPARFGVYEYLWTSPEKLEVLQAEPQLTLATVPAAPPEIAQAADSAAESAAAAAAVPIAEPELPDKAPMGEKEEEERDWKTALRSPMAAVYAGLAVAVIGIATFVGVRLARDSSRHPAVITTPATTSTPASNPASTPATTTAPPESNTPAAGSTTPAPPAVKTTPPPPAHKPVQAVEKHPAQPAAPSAPCNLSGDVSRYVGLAEQARGRGDYANAERRFREILACDPSNAAAQQGLNRAIQGEEQSRHQ